jgi:hypothetical protein
MLAAAMQAPPAGLALVLELTHSGFQLMIPMAAATVTATVVARHVDGYSIYTARLRAHPGPAEAAARRRPGAGRERARWVTAFRSGPGDGGRRDLKGRVSARRRLSAAAAASRTSDARRARR